MALGDAYTSVAVGAFGTTTAEAVVATSPVQPTTGEGGQGNYITGVVNFPAAVATAVITVKVRQNTITGTVVGTFGPYTVGTASVGAVIPIACLDASAAAAGVAQYVATVTVATAASGVGNTVAFGVTPAGLNG